MDNGNQTDQASQSQQSENTVVESSSQAMSPNGPEPNSTDEQSLAIERAEEILGDLGHRTGNQLTNLGRNILRAGARAREEAEDIWAEARSIRRGQ